MTISHEQWIFSPSDTGERRRAKDTRPVIGELIDGRPTSTTIEMLCTIRNPDSGSARVAGFDLGRQSDDVRRAIGVTGQFAAVDERLHVQDGDPSDRLLAEQGQHGAVDRWLVGSG